ncbi:MAG: pyridoxal-phosphate dependent enzyme [Gemmatimonadota bacterium]|nr:pyridoxal-phosphate dependent enzyme [Gemmatimonadota bacterium]
MLPTLSAIRDARARIAGRVHQTPLFSATLIGRQCGVQLSLKCESFQKTGSFKARGALNAVMLLSDDARSRGVVTVSAGNHAQALAWAAASAGVRCTVVMPATASETKAAASAGYGAEVIRHGTGAEAFGRANEIAKEHGMTFVHPFDDPMVLAGAGTTGLEILEQAPDVEVVIVPIGGGGLIGGVASAIKQLRPDVHIIGVEPEGAAAMRQSIDAGHPVRLASLNTIADGLAAPFAGDIAFEVVTRFVDDVVLVTDAEISAAMSILLSRAKLLAEPAGAAATAALLAKKISAADGKRVVSIVSGGNVDLDRLRTLI